MEMFTALEAFASLSQETRLRVFRLLIEYGRNGAVPGELAKELKVPDNTLSFHLSHLTRAGLVTSKRNGRSISYFASTELVEELIEFLQVNCCAREEKPGKPKARKGERSC